MMRRMSCSWVVARLSSGNKRRTLSSWLEALHKSFDATKLTELNGWSVVPDNKPGAGTALGLAEGARANPAGYDLVIGQTDNVTLIPLLMKVQYDPRTDFIAVS